MSVLSNKAYKEYERLSRYSAFPYYFQNVDKKYIYGTTSQLVTDDVPFTIYEIQRGDTLDSIALQFYNDPTKYWIVADFNHIQDPLLDLKMGDTLKIPNLSSIAYR